MSSRGSVVMRLGHVTGAETCIYIWGWDWSYLALLGSEGFILHVVVPGVVGGAWRWLRVVVVVGVMCGCGLSGVPK